LPFFSRETRVVYLAGGGFIAKRPFSVRQEKNVRITVICCLKRQDRTVVLLYVESISKRGLGRAEAFSI
jgi:hypothetical protein